jgi:membrane protein DedA with SNARE-associated domain
MVDLLLEFLAGIAIYLISTFGYFGIILAMAIESACIPLPSEIIMPFSGYLVSTGHFNLILVALAGAVGCVFGSVAAYLVGYYGGESLVRQLIRKYGRYVLVFEYELDEAEHWFTKHGPLITFFSRLLPVVRTFISLPAGIAKMPIKSFIFYTFIGSLIWSYALAKLGKILGDNWNSLGTYFHRFDFLILLIIFALGVFYVYHKLSKHRHYLKKHSNS